MGSASCYHHRQPGRANWGIPADIIVTAGLIAGGSATIHELMALVDDFLKKSRTRANQS